MFISKVEDAMHMDRSQQTVMRMISEQERAATVRELSAVVIQRVWRAVHPSERVSSRESKKRFEAMEQVTSRPDACFILRALVPLYRRTRLSASFLPVMIDVGIP
jgi:hypothetical protein